MPHSFPTRRSSDLIVLQLPARRAPRLTIGRHPRLLRRPAAFLEVARRAGGGDILPRRSPAQPARHDMIESQILARYAILARESVDLKSAVWGKSVSVRVDIGGRRILKKQQHQTNTNYSDYQTNI